MASSVEGLERLKAKIAKLSEAARQQTSDANQKSATEFMNKVAAIVPRSNDPDGIELVNTLKMTEGGSGTGWIVSIGGPGAPYPAHLEFGHIGPGGNKVEAVPFWYPARRVGLKRHKNRAGRALNKAVKITAGLS